MLQDRSQWRWLLVLLALAASAMVWAQGAKGVTYCASLTAGNELPDLPIDSVSISGDGNCVAFLSKAGNLLAGNQGGNYLKRANQVNAFVYDHRTGAINCASRANGVNGEEANGERDHPSQ